jgi:hypothetical protein
MKKDRIAVAIELIQFARNNNRTRVLIGADGPYLLHPWWEKGLRQQIKVLAAAKPTTKEKKNA